MEKEEHLGTNDRNAKTEQKEANPAAVSSSSPQPFLPQLGGHSHVEEEKKEESDEAQPLLMPIAINTSRPPSTASVPQQQQQQGAGGVAGAAAGSAAAAAAASTPRTTTSRRGGRTRSRSPPVIGGRTPPPGGAADVLQSAAGAAGGGGGDNPSSAAAAAAAAAKAYSSGAGGGDEHHPANFEKQYAPSSRQQWPGEEPSRGGYHQQQQQQMRQRYQQQQGGAAGYPGGYREGDPAAAYNDRRYRGRYDPSQQERGGGRYPPQRGGSGAAGYPPDYRYDQRGGGADYHPSSRSQHPHQQTHPHHKPGAQQQRPGGGTSIVLGGATPIHLPKPSTGSYERQERGASSVFRHSDSSSRSSARAPPPNNPEQEDSPQKILLSLRTPSTSFEERERAGAGNAKKNSGLALSPDDPPQIHNSHQSGRQQDALFEPQKSSEGLGTKPSASIDMAPSFTLFNQSFDSFGDTNYFNVDSSLQNDSFGMARTTSGVENEGAGSSTQILQKNSSVGGASQQLLASASGALTIGYSPVNSFGNTSVASRRAGEPPNMMYLGGSDARSSSPSQVLNMYRSYSGGGSAAGGAGAGSTAAAPGARGPEILDDSHMRMSVGSFGGGPTMSYGGASTGGGARPYAEPSSGYYGGAVRPAGGGDRGPHFYVTLRKVRLAFKDCTFLLPGLKAALLEAPGADGAGEDAVKSGGQDTHPSARFGEPSPQDTAVARRRVECSVCAFGGSLRREPPAKPKDEGKDAIFRGKEEPEAQQSVTVTPSSSVASPKGPKNQSQARIKYEEALASRYYENESRLSWEFEESPPVEAIGEEPKSDKEKSANDESSTAENKDGKEKSGDGGSEKAADDGDASTKTGGSVASPQPKMRYRCKLCGQPKQNHRCPYQQSLARSIGVMIYPAVNAFTAAEPGSISAALSDMNNFVDMKDLGSSDDSPGRPTPERMHMPGTGAVSTSTQVTPESMRSNKLHSSSPFTTPGRSVSRHRTLGRQGNSKKRSYSQVSAAGDDHGDLLFIESMDLKHEQFRVIAEPKGKKQDERFNYPALPLPYAQRKKLSDNLFSLSNEVPKLTDECAQVLREAREKDMWDLAVAELMTQVVVILHCPDGDKRFEGLRQYLLTLGIAC